MTKSNIPAASNMFVHPTEFPDDDTGFRTIPGIRIYPYALVHISAALGSCGLSVKELIERADSIARECCRRIQKHTEEQP